MPSADFQRSADCLDPVRRWKQVVECHQLLDALNGKPGREGKPNRLLSHPCLKMWVGYTQALRLYTNHMLCTVLREKTHKVTAYRPFDFAGIGVKASAVPMPPWLGWEKFHRSQRSNLLRKDEQFYRRFGWTEPTDLPYEWPSPTGEYDTAPVLDSLFDY